MASAESVGRIRATFAVAPLDALPTLMARYGHDSRAGVCDAVGHARRRLERAGAERQRLVRLHELQRRLHDAGYSVVAGIDEVGRGALAGPVTAAAVVLPTDRFIEGLTDSKVLSPRRRAALDVSIRRESVSVSIAHISPAEIDECGITEATRRAMSAALDGLHLPVDHAIVDGLPVALGIPLSAVVKGDRSVGAVAAASIVAKVARDALMTSLDHEFPGYGLSGNKGYGSPEHLRALDALGPCAIHRRSFAPVSALRLF